MLSSIIVSFQNLQFVLPPGIRKSKLVKYINEMENDLHRKDISFYESTSYLKDLREEIADRINLLQSILQALDPVPYLVDLPIDEVEQMQFRQVTIPTEYLDFVEECLNFYSVIYVAPPRLSIFGNSLIYISATSIDDAVIYVRQHNVTYENNPYGMETLNHFLDQLIDLHCQIFSLCDKLYDGTYGNLYERLTNSEFYLRSTLRQYEVVSEEPLKKEIQGAINAATYQLGLISIWDSKLCTLIDEFCFEEAIFHNEKSRYGLPHEANPECELFNSMSFSEREALAYLSYTPLFRNSCTNYYQYDGEVIEAEVEISNDGNFDQTSDDDPYDSLAGSVNQSRSKRSLGLAVIRKVGQTAFKYKLQTSWSKTGFSSVFNSLKKFRFKKPNFATFGNTRKRLRKFRWRTTTKRGKYNVRCKRSGRGCGKQSVSSQSSEAAANVDRATPSLIDDTAEYLSARSVPSEAPAGLRRLSSRSSETLANAAEQSRYKQSATSKMYFDVDEASKSAQASKFPSTLSEMFSSKKSIKKITETKSQPSSSNIYNPGTRHVGEDVADSLNQIGSSSNSIPSTPGSAMRPRSHSIWKKPSSSIAKRFKSFEKEVAHNDILKKRRRLRKDARTPPESANGLTDDMNNLNVQSDSGLLDTATGGAPARSQPIDIPAPLHSVEGAPVEYQNLAKYRKDWRSDPFQPSLKWPNDNWAKSSVKSQGSRKSLKTNSVEQKSLKAEVHEQPNVGMGGTQFTPSNAGSNPPANSDRLNAWVLEQQKSIQSGTGSSKTLTKPNYKPSPANAPKKAQSQAPPQGQPQAPPQGQPQAPPQAQSQAHIYNEIPEESIRSVRTNYVQREMNADTGRIFTPPNGKPKYVQKIGALQQRITMKDWGTMNGLQKFEYIAKKSMIFGPVLALTTMMTVEQGLNIHNMIANAGLEQQKFEAENITNYKNYKMNMEQNRFERQLERDNFWLDILDRIDPENKLSPGAREDALADYTRALGLQMKRSKPIEFQNAKKGLEEALNNINTAPMSDEPQDHLEILLAKQVALEEFVKILNLTDSSHGEQVTDFLDDLGGDTAEIYKDLIDSYSDNLPTENIWDNFHNRTNLKTYVTSLTNFLVGGQTNDFSQKDLLRLINIAWQTYRKKTYNIGGNYFELDTNAIRLALDETYSSNVTSFSQLKDKLSDVVKVIRSQIELKYPKSQYTELDVLHNELANQCDRIRCTKQFMNSVITLLANYQKNTLSAYDHRNFDPSLHDSRLNYVLKALQYIVKWNNVFEMPPHGL